MFHLCDWKYLEKPWNGKYYLVSVGEIYKYNKVLIQTSASISKICFWIPYFHDIFLLDLSCYPDDWYIYACDFHVDVLYGTVLVLNVRMEQFENTFAIYVYLQKDMTKDIYCCISVMVLIDIRMPYDQ